MAKPMQQWFDEYAADHQHPTNRLTHKFAIPVIVFHILAMLDWIDLPVHLFDIPGVGPYSLSVAHVFFVLVIGWYMTLSPKLAVLSAIAFVPLILVGAYTPVAVVIGLAIAGWFVQLAGHVVWEKRSPSFLRNIVQALIGPLFFLALVTGDYVISERPAPAT